MRDEPVPLIVSHIIMVVVYSRVRDNDLRADQLLIDASLGLTPEVRAFADDDD